MDTTAVRLPPAAEVIEEEEIVQHLSPLLLTVNYQDKHVQVAMVAGSLAFFLLVFVAIIFTCNLFPAFRNQKSKIKIFMGLSVVRGLFGIFGFVIGVYATFYTTNLQRDVVFGKTATSSVAMLVSAGFFIFELVTVVVSDIVFKSFSKMLIIHHALGVILYTGSLSLDVNYCNGSMALILEMSTPFSCLCYMLLKAGMENSLLWKINQMILIHSFHLRSAMECYIWYFTYKHWTQVWNNLPAIVLVPTYFALVLVTLVMTPYWGYKKTQQLFHPIDWNFQESRTRISNGHSPDVHEISKKIN